MSFSTPGQSNEVEPNNTPAAATPLDLSGGYVATVGSISILGDVDYYSFSASAGSKVWLLVDTGGDVEGADSFVTLLGANGSTVIEEDDDDGSGNGCDGTEESNLASAIAGRTLPSGGTFYVRVNEFGDDNFLSSYRLVIVISPGTAASENEPNESPDSATPIVTTDQTTGLLGGTINFVGDKDVFSVFCHGGETLFIAADGDPERDGLGMDLILDLISVDRTTELYTANSSISEGNAAEAFCYTVPATGTYYVRVQNGEGGTGAYMLMVASRPSGSLQFSASTYRVLESVGTVQIEVVRGGSGAGTMSVHYQTTNGSAVSPSDFSAISGTLTFGEGVLTQSFGINIVGDLSAESNETIQLTLSAPTGGAMLGSTSSAVLVILDDDEPPNNTAATASALNLSGGYASTQDLQALPPALSPPGDQDWYSFVAPAGAKAWLFVDTGGVSTAGANSRDSQLALFEDDGITMIEEDDDDGSGNGCGPVMVPDGGLASAIAGRTLNAAGPYRIRIRAFDGQQIVEPYSLFVAVTTTPALSELEGNDSAAEATPLVARSSALGHRLAAIGSARDKDYYSVYAPSGSVLYVSADCDPYRDGQGTDLVVDLLSSDGSTLLFSADSSEDEAESAEAFCFRIAVSGTYFVRVQHFFSSETGPYALMVARSESDAEPNGTTATAVPLAIKPGFVAARGSVIAGDEDLYVVTPGEGGRLWAVVDTGGLQTAGASSRDSTLTLLASNGTTVIEEDLNDGTATGLDGTIESGDASALAGRAVTSGTSYYLRVKSGVANQTINPYQLFVTVLPETALSEIEPNDSSVLANPILEGGDLSNQRQGQIGMGADADVYSLAVSAGETLFLGVDGDPERDGIGT
ncbi:MAG TPA: pre-peptidase C-terminal domain-containing protein, partial [Verrucomicrobiae bacterium]|nr:pre-peptidase C-terminal domain-containing protein [Verrucomicrobiae bacterium]